RPPTAPSIFCKCGREISRLLREDEQPRMAVEQRCQQGVSVLCLAGDETSALIERQIFHQYCQHRATFHVAARKLGDPPRFCTKVDIVISRGPKTNRQIAASRLQTLSMDCNRAAFSLSKYRRKSMAYRQAAPAVD